MLFTIFQNEKTRFQAIKERSSKSGKIAIFPGLAHGFSQKLAIFPSFIFKGNIGRENVFYDILERKNHFLGYKKKSLKSGKIAIDQNGLVHGFGKKLDIFPSFFLATQVRKMCFTIFQNEKTPFQAIKTSSSKSGKIVILAKGLVHGFGQKLAIFPNFFLRQYSRGK